MPLKQYISVHIIVGLILSAVLIWAFAAVAEEISEDDRAVVNFDVALANVLHATTTPGIARTYWIISLFGSQLVWVFGVLLAGYYLWKRRWIHLSVWLIAIVGGNLLNYLLKLYFGRPRPPYVGVFSEAINPSFPSGHAMLSVIAYGMLAYFLILVVRDRRAQIVIVFAAVLMAVLIGISRLYLGVHYLSDVVAGFLVGGVWLTTCITAMEYIRHRQSKRALHEDT